MVLANQIVGFFEWMRFFHSSRGTTWGQLYWRRPFVSFILGSFKKIDDISSFCDDIGQTYRPCSFGHKKRLGTFITNRFQECSKLPPSKVFLQLVQWALLVFCFVFKSVESSAFVLFNSFFCFCM